MCAAKQIDSTKRHRHNTFLVSLGGCGMKKIIYLVISQHKTKDYDYMAHGGYYSREAAEKELHKMIEGSKRMHDWPFEYYIKEVEL